MASDQAILNQQWNVASMAEATEIERQRPCVIFSARISEIRDGYRAYIGKSPFSADIYADGSTPSLAMLNFDKKWRGEK